MTFSEFFVGLGLFLWFLGIFKVPWSVVGKLWASGVGLVVFSLNIYLHDYFLFSLLTYELALVGFYLLRGSITRNQLEMQIYFSMVIWLVLLMGRLDIETFQGLGGYREWVAILVVVILAAKAGFIVPFEWWESKISSDKVLVSGLGLCLVTSVACSTIHSLLPYESDSNISLLVALLLVSSGAFLGSSLVHSGITSVIADWHRFNGSALLFVQVHISQTESITPLYLGFCLYFLIFLALLSKLENICKTRLKNPQFLDFTPTQALSESGMNVEKICHILAFWGVCLSGIFLYLCLFIEKFQVQTYTMALFSIFLPALFYVRIRAGRPFV